MNRTRVTAALIVLGIGVMLAGALTFMLSRGFSARDEPSRVEAFIAKRLRRMAVPRAAREMSNPVPASSEFLSQAMEHFADHCAFCHANDGSGNTPIGKGLYPKPPDMRQFGTQNMSDGELFYIIQNGVRFTGMPAFGAPEAADDEDSWKLVLFIRHLPQITDEELGRMKEMNPKTPADLQEEEEIKRFLEGNDDAPPSNSHKHH